MRWRSKSKPRAQEERPSLKESSGDRGRRSGFPDQRVDAPTSRAVEENEQKNEAVEDGGFSVINDRVKAALGVDHEIGHGHFAARNQSRDPSQQPERDQEATDQLNDGADIHDASAGAVTSWRKTEKLLAAMRSEEQAHEQSHDTVNRIRESRQRVHGREAVRPGQ